jgi:hypothetical protein
MPIATQGAATHDEPMRATLSSLTLLLLAVVLTPDCLADSIIPTTVTASPENPAERAGESGRPTDYAGEIKIDWQHVARLTGDEPMTVQLTTHARVWQRDRWQHAPHRSRGRRPERPWR